VWDQIIGPLAANARHVTVVDRFAGERLVNMSGISGFAGFAERLNGSAPNATLEVFTQVHRGLSSADVEFEFRQVCEAVAQDLGRIQLRLVNKSDWSVHPRHIRFDGAVLRLDGGLNLFESEQISTAVDLGIATRFSVREREGMLENFSRDVEIKPREGWPSPQTE